MRTPDETRREPLRQARLLVLAPGSARRRRCAAAEEDGGGAENRSGLLRKPKPAFFAIKLSTTAKAQGVVGVSAMLGGRAPQAVFHEEGQREVAATPFQNMGDRSLNFVGNDDI